MSNFKLYMCYLLLFCFGITLIQVNLTLHSDWKRHEKRPKRLKGTSEKTGELLHLRQL